MIWLMLLSIPVALTIFLIGMKVGTLTAPMPTQHTTRERITT